MDPSAQPKTGHWSIGPRIFSSTECLNRHYLAYQERREMILAKAAVTLGNRDISTQWFNKPARGLNYRSPCSVVTDDQGLQQVVDYLARIEFGVYC